MLAHELDYLTNENLFSNAAENDNNNGNSIIYLLRQIPGTEYKQRRIVSPYLFARQYYDDAGNPALVESDQWRELVNHPRLKIYETGRLDARELGGDTDYGKLHSKYIVLGNTGFVGTTNFDDRSGLINNEMGGIKGSSSKSQRAVYNPALSWDGQAALTGSINQQAVSLCSGGACSFS